MNHARLQAICKDLLIEIGEDVTREGLRDTPRRFADFWYSFIEQQPFAPTTFTTTQTDQMVVVSGMRVWSLCEHHLLPFWCDISIGYIARERILGLSKFARIAHACASKLQSQERLVDDIASAISDATGSNDVAVIARGEHLCMLMRGIRTPAVMTSSVMRGVFFDKPPARAEFIQLSHEK